MYGPTSGTLVALHTGMGLWVNRININHLFKNSLRLVPLLFNLNSGCLTEARDSLAQTSQVPDLQDDGVVTAPTKVLCGPHRAVVSVDEQDHVVCDQPRLSGEPVFVNNEGVVDCAEDEELVWKTVVGRYGTLDIPTCRQKKIQGQDDVTFGSGPTHEFYCPWGSALAGFNEKGEGVCRTLMSRQLTGMVFFADHDECPWGMSTGTFNHPDFSVNSCAMDSRSPRDLVLAGRLVVKKSHQLNKICSDEQVVVGFDENDHIICGPLSSVELNSVRRYWTVNFEVGHPERPVCRVGYEPMDLRLKWRVVSNTNSSIKIWTCRRL